MISYVRLDKAWRMSDGKDYAGLTFRYAVVGRDVVGGKETLLGASRNDAEVMVCFMRLLDHDCDGQISEADYVHAITRGPQAAIVGLASLDERWQQAAVKLEKG